jgi:hypothetical protein
MMSSMRNGHGNSSSWTTRRAFGGTISPGEAASGLIIEDEGHQNSDYDSDDSVYEFDESES